MAYRWKVKENLLMFQNTICIFALHFPEYFVKILKPPRLRTGDLIGVVSPASTIADPTRIEKGVSYLEKMGYRTCVGEHVLKTYGYLAGTDEERAGDLHAMFRNREVKAIMCIRGGYGTPRLLSLINYPLVGRNPKIFVGYSDITSLQLALLKKCGLVTFQGPMVGVDMPDVMDGLTEGNFWQLLTSPTKAGSVLPAGEPVNTMREGKATGTLVGGNLAHFVASLGTPYMPQLKGALIFLEDIGEEPYRVDRMLSQLRHASILRKAAGILAGQFTHCTPKDASAPSLSLDDVFREIAALAPTPFMSNLPFGHEARKMTMPIGIRARMNASQHTLEFLEGAVR
jgi:muramoyltetrapeptide carboxypeptidase